MLWYFDYPRLEPTHWVQFPTEHQPAGMFKNSVRKFRALMFGEYLAAFMEEKDAKAMLLFSDKESLQAVKGNYFLEIATFLSLLLFLMTN